jgi:hypothetical protein
MVPPALAPACDSLSAVTTRRRPGTLASSKGQSRWSDFEAAKDMKISVECYAGYRGEEEPRAFKLGERRFAVLEILDRWLAPITATSR